MRLEFRYLIIVIVKTCNIVEISVNQMYWVIGNMPVNAQLFANTVFVTQYLLCYIVQCLVILVCIFPVVLGTKM